nr:histidine phosphatase family protein [Endozoicomonas sp.]
MTLQTLLRRSLKKAMAFCFGDSYCIVKKSGLIVNALFTLYFLPVGVYAANAEFAMTAPADYLVSLVRHGDRSPRDLGDMARYWPMGPGQLTVEGFEQMFLLGQKIRSHYFSETLLDVWSPTVSQHYAKGLDRTIQSASALLLGVYPGLSGGTQIPPVYASPLISDGLFSAQRLCPGYLHRVQALESSADWLRKKVQYRNQLASWLGGRKGEDLESLYSLVPLMDQVAIHRMHHLPMPKGMSSHDAMQLEALLHWVTSKIFGNHEVAQLIGTPLVKAMIRDFKRVQQCLEEKGSGHSCQRWTLYSASDSNLLAMMTMLGAPSDKIVDYATHFGVQLNWNGGRPEVALSLNHEYFAVPGCVGHCSLDQWLVLLEQPLPDDWDYLCGRDVRDRGWLSPHSEPYIPKGSVARR